MSLSSSPRSSLWEDGLESSRQVFTLGCAAILTVVALDLLISGGLSMFFDLCFVLLCLGLALAARPGDFLTVAQVPPLIIVLVFGLLALTRPETIAHPDDGVAQAFISGIALHAIGLFAGYALCLATLVARQRSRTA